MELKAKTHMYLILTNQTTESIQWNWKELKVDCPPPAGITAGIHSMELKEFLRLWRLLGQALSRIHSMELKEGAWAWAGVAKHTRIHSMELKVYWYIGKSRILLLVNPFNGIERWGCWVRRRWGKQESIQWNWKVALLCRKTSTNLL